MHGKPACATGHQASQQILMLHVVSEGQLGVACKLILSQVPDLLTDNVRDRDRNPLLLWLQPATYFLCFALPFVPRFLRCTVLVAVGVGGPGIDWICNSNWSFGLSEIG